MDTHTRTHIRVCVCVCVCVCDHQSHRDIEHFTTFPLFSFLFILVSTDPQFSSVQFSRSVMSDSLRPHEPQHARPPCPSPTPGVYPNPCPLGRWCHPTTSSLSSPFSSCLQSFIEVIATVSSNTFGWFCLLLNILKIEWRIRTLLCLDFFTFNIKTERLTQVDFVWTSRSFFSIVVMQLFQHPLLKRPSFPNALFLYWK